VENVAKKKDERHKVQLEFSYDRLSKNKLLQAYGILVPEKLKVCSRLQINVEQSDIDNPRQDENSSDIFSRVI